MPAVVLAFDEGRVHRHWMFENRVQAEQFVANMTPGIHGRFQLRILDLRPHSLYGT